VSSGPPIDIFAVRRLQSVSRSACLDRRSVLAAVEFANRHRSQVFPCALIGYFGLFGCQNDFAEAVFCACNVSDAAFLSASDDPLQPARQRTSHIRERPLSRPTCCCEANGFKKSERERAVKHAGNVCVSLSAACALVWTKYFAVDGTSLFPRHIPAQQHAVLSVLRSAILLAEVIERWN